MICRAVRDEIRHDAVDVPDEHEVVAVVDLEQRVLLPCVLSVTDAGAEHLGKADAAAFPQPQRCRAGIKGMDKPGVVLGKEVPFGIFFHQPFDAPPVGKQILPCVGVQRLDAVLRMIEQRDALIQRVNLSDGVVQISRLFGLRILCEVGDADQDAVFFLLRENMFFLFACHLLLRTSFRGFRESPAFSMAITSTGIKISCRMMPGMALVTAPARNRAALNALWVRPDNTR